MRPALILTLLGCALAGVALAQKPPTIQVPPPPPAGMAPPPPKAGAAESEYAAPRSFGNSPDGACGYAGRA